jgi:hypothetical protein
MSTATLDKNVQTTALAAGPNQKYWDIGLASFNSGDVATTAMQKIWAAMAPPASLPLLASIVGALFGDTYWATTKMDVNLLAGDLQAALGLNPADCQKAAKFAFQNWYGLVVRGNFGDNGGIPKSDPVTASPDVVVNGKAALTVQQLVTQWNVFIYTPQPGLKNNTYGRAQSLNIQVPITQPTLQMFFSDAGFNTPPSSWIQQFTFDGDPTSPMQTINPGPVPVGGRIANSNAFAFTPPGAGHYCLIAVVGTEFFTNNPLNTPGNWNSTEWIHCNGAAGWHNVDVVQSNQESLKFANQDGVPETFVFEARCSNLPKGTVVSLRCDDQRLAYAIDSRGVKINSAYQIVSTKAEIPPNFVGDLQVQIDTPDGKTLPAGAAVDVSMDWHLSRDHERYIDAVDLLGDTRALHEGHPVRVPMGNFTFVGKD